MSRTNTLHIFCGLPASGKSTEAEKIMAQEPNTILVSSDAIRQELFDDVDNQDNNDAVFKEYFKRAKKALTEGYDVILDATNISVKGRRNTMEQLQKYATGVIAHYFNTSYERCIQRNYNRDRHVPLYVIDRMYKSLQIPTYNEGFDKIIFHNQSKKKDENNIEFEYFNTTLREIEDYISSPQTYVEIMGGNPYWYQYLQGIWELPQDNSFHSFSVSRHTYHVWKYILENYNGEDKLVMLWAGLFHDVGKAFCKNFKKFEDGTISRYANFIGHENVSAQIAAHALSKYYDTDFVLMVVDIVQNHMRLMNIDDTGAGKSYNKLLGQVGQDVMSKLEFFYEADSKAK